MSFGLEGSEFMDILTRAVILKALCVLKLRDIVGWGDADKGARMRKE